MMKNIGMFGVFYVSNMFLDRQPGYLAKTGWYRSVLFGPNTLTGRTLMAFHCFMARVFNKKCKHYDI